MTNNNETREGFESALRAEKERLESLTEATPGLEWQIVEYEVGDINEEEVAEFEKWYQAEFPILAAESKLQRILYLNGLKVADYTEQDLSDAEAEEFEKKGSELVGEEFILKLKADRGRKDEMDEVIKEMVDANRRVILEELGLTWDTLVASMGKAEAVKFIVERTTERKLRQKKKN